RGGLRGLLPLPGQRLRVVGPADGVLDVGLQLADPTLRLLGPGRRRPHLPILLAEASLEMLYAAGRGPQALLHLAGARPQEHQLVLRRHELVLGLGELPLRSLRSFPRRLQLLLDLRVGPPLEARGGASRLEESLQA